MLRQCIRITPNRLMSLGFLGLAAWGRRLENLQRGERMLVGIDDLFWRLKNRTRLARIRVYSEHQPFARKLSEIDGTVDDGLRWIGNLGVLALFARDNFCDEGNLRCRCKDRVNW